MSEYRSLETPIEMLGDRAVRYERIAGLIGVVGLILCVLGYFIDSGQVLQSYLFAFIYWSGFAFGGLGILLMNNTVGGRWGVTTRRFLEAKIRTIPFVLLLFIPILLGIHYLYPWAQPHIVQTNAIVRHKVGYLNMPFFIARVLLYFSIWCFWGFRLIRWSDEQDQTGDVTLRDRMRAFSAPGVLVFFLTATFAYIDWVLSADAEFYSTVYAGMIIFGAAVQTFALTIVTLILSSKQDRFGGRVNAPLLHDLGNMMFAFTIFWTYLAASQLIIVWPGNLPQEIHWYLVRVRGGWTVIAAAVSLVAFLIPFLALLSQDRKRDPKRLIRVAIWLLCARAVDVFWVVIPTYRQNGFAIYWTDFAAFLGIGGIWVYLYLGALRKRPLLPLRDSRVAQPMPEAAV
ncbi:MAG TPA: hypothetical protein VH325_07600 [Bryobacteraceae bacterium]|nr:hypothetical protein [Bryobacteraceae bacterium]